MIEAAERFRIIIARNLHYRRSLSHDFRNVVKRPKLKPSTPYGTLEDLWELMSHEERSDANFHMAALVNGEVSIEEYANETPYIDYELEGSL
jgi:hypothetical protein